MQPKTREVLLLKANGMLSKQIAFKLAVHRRTVEWHIKSACKELKANNSTHAVALAMRDGLIMASEIGCMLILCWAGLFGNVDLRRGPSTVVARIARREVIV